MDMPVLQVDFWDVGYGDAAVVWLSTDRVIIIDCGPNNSPLPAWVDKHGIRVDLVVLTHNDNDHFEGFLNLRRVRGHEVGAYAMVRDRPEHQLRRALQELTDGLCKGWPEPIPITTRRNKPLDLLAEAELPKHQFTDFLALHAFHPSLLKAWVAERRGPNWGSALVVLSLDGHPAIAWPGDLPLQTCHDVLTANNVRPRFLVGPHHGGPIDLSVLSKENACQLLGEIGHRESWISVAWHQRRRHPRPKYLASLKHVGTTVRCSQLTCRCDTQPQRFHPGLLPTHDWLGLERPPKGTSCMGAMRVIFSRDSHEVLFAEEHRQALLHLQRPRCGWQASPAHLKPAIPGH
jgi:hypothetical protein